MPFLPIRCALDWYDWTSGSHAEARRKKKVGYRGTEKPEMQRNPGPLHLSFPLCSSVPHPLFFFLPSSAPPRLRALRVSA
jgi:hypothetical protein